MTKDKFNADVNALIAQLVLRSMKSYAANQAIDDQIEAEPIDDRDSIFTADDYNDELRDKYNQLKGG
jgi:uncharacterized phosphosugar-binding protein